MVHGKTPTSLSWHWLLTHLYDEGVHICAQMSEETPPSAATHWLLMHLYVSPEGLGDAEGPGDAPSNLSAVVDFVCKD